jgi:formate hydrogenlyase subunit 4
MIESFLYLAAFLLLAAGATLFGLLFTGADRILVARMQGRIGPPLLQPFYDLAKLREKEETVPAGAVGWLFRACPAVAAAAALTLCAFVPLFGFEVPGAFAWSGDIVFALYLLLIPGTAMVVGGFASASPYAAIGAQREMVTMASYELPLATAVLAFAWRLAHAGVPEPLAFASFAETPVWSLVGPLGAVGGLLLAAAVVAVVPGELGRIPFDSPEAETELAGGLLVEYGGASLGLFHVAMAVKTVAFAAMAVALFCPYRFGLWAPVAFFLKVGALLFVSVTLPRAAMARLRIRNVAAFYFTALGAIALSGALLVVLDAFIAGGAA